MPPHQVNGVVNESILLPIHNISSSEKVKQIDWDFQGQTGPPVSIAELIDGKWERPNLEDQFGTRLELPDETTLRIRNLKKEDGGVYRARVRLQTATIQRHTFHLVIYDPVPAPQILHQGASRSSSGCNVTLQCWVSEKAGLNVSWRIRPLGGGASRYLSSSDGWHLHVYVRSSPLDSSITCLVANPASEKSASISLLSVCPAREDGGRDRLWWLVFPIAALIIIALAAGIYICKKWRERCPRKAASAVSLSSVPDHLYSEVAKRRSSPEGTDGQEFLSPPEQHPTAKPPTIYSLIEAPTHRSDQFS